VHLAGPSYALDTSASASGFQYQSWSGTRGSKSPNGREYNLGICYTLFIEHDTMDLKMK